MAMVPTNFKMWLLKSALIAGFLFVLAPVYAGAFSWPQFQTDASHRGVAVVSGPSAAGSTAQILADLFAQGGGQLVGPIVIGKDGDIIAPLRKYNSGSIANVYALSDSGTLKWKSNDINLPGFCCGFEISPVVNSAGNVFFVNGIALIGLHPDGTSLFTFPFDATAAGSKIVIDSQDVMFIVHGGTLYAVNSDGSLKWKSRTLNASAVVRYIPAISTADDLVYVLDSLSTDYGFLISYQRSTGTLVRQQLISGVPVTAKASVVTPGGLILVPSNMGANSTRLWAYDANLEQRWFRNLSFTMRNAPLVRDNGQIIIADSGQILVLDGITGAAISTFQMPSSGLLSQAVMDKDGVVYVGQGNMFYGISLATNQIIWSKPIGASIEPFHALGDDGTLYITTLAGASANLIAIKGTPPKPDPVIIVPGILGSWFHNGQLVLDPIMHTYDNLINALVEKGYVEGQTLFTFPYDWFQDNNQTAELLKNKIQEVKATCQCQKVDIIAHSMGGLVARAYIESNAYQNDIGQLILVGTPNQGSPRSYLAWEGGEIIPIVQGLDDIRSKILEYYLSIEAKVEGFSSRFSFVRSRPVFSLQQLLPNYDYLEDKDTSQLRRYPENYPVNLFLDVLNNSLALNKLVQSGARITNIVGNIEPNVSGNTTQDTTIGTIRVVSPTLSQSPKWENGYPEGFDSIFGDHGLETAEGDGTVPLSSASFLPGIASTIVQQSDRNLHAHLPTVAWPEIYNVLTGLTVQQIQNPILAENILFIPVFSPVDIAVIDPLGRKIGKDFSSGQEVGEIPLAFYSGFDSDREFIAIPNPIDGEYKIETQGTGSGHYELQATYISDATSTTHSFVGNTILGLLAGLDLNFSVAAPENIAIIPVDELDPITAVVVSGARGMNGWHTSDVSVAFSAQDNEGGIGVFKTEFSLDNGVSWAIYSAPLTFTQEGASTLLYRSQDFVGNTEEPKTLEIKIDKMSPEASVSLGIDSFDLEIKGSDISSTTVSAISEKSYQVQDEAGHTLTINFKKLKDKKRSLHIVLESIQYDSAPVITLPKNTLNYEWSINKKEDELRVLNQQLIIKDQLRTHLVFKEKKNQTEVKVVTGKKKDKQTNKESMPGLSVLKLVTDSGNLNFEF
ncbi:MAG: PQQ-binding-like beta-propeller repeat protein [bacterium]|nr:PQQ-binding-like beta-propeller repeat protein [bacterium]